MQSSWETITNRRDWKYGSGLSTFFTIIRSIKILNKIEHFFSPVYLPILCLRVGIIIAYVFTRFPTKYMEMRWKNLSHFELCVTQCKTFFSGFTEDSSLSTGKNMLQNICITALFTRVKFIHAAVVTTGMSLAHFLSVWFSSQSHFYESDSLKPFLYFVEQKAYGTSEEK